MNKTYFNFSLTISGTIYRWVKLGNKNTKYINRTFSAVSKIDEILRVLLN